MQWQSRDAVQPSVQNRVLGKVLNTLDPFDPKLDARLLVAE